MGKYTKNMPVTSFIVNAFVDPQQNFKGNAAAVTPLQEWLPAEQMLQAARRNGLAETAFFIPAPKDSPAHFCLRWFTPDIEMDLCGHATLATAYTIATQLGFEGPEIIFDTSSGIVKVAVSGDMCTLDFPSREPQKAELLPNIYDSLSIKPLEITKARDYVLLYESEDDIRNISLNRKLFDQVSIDPGGVIVTAPGKDCDFVSRFFTPQATILEDPVTGSAHCSLIPYWGEKLGRKEMLARQLSAEGGTLICSLEGDRVRISGRGEVVKKFEINFG